MGVELELRELEFDNEMVVTDEVALVASLTCTMRLETGLGRAIRVGWARTLDVAHAIRVCRALGAGGEACVPVEARVAHTVGEIAAQVARVRVGRTEVLDTKVAIVGASNAWLAVEAA